LGKSSARLKVESRNGTTISVPAAASDPYATVIVLELKGAPQVIE
jgi:hypothetical protein